MKKLVIASTFAAVVLSAAAAAQTVQYLPLPVLTAQTNSSYVAEGDSITFGFNDTPAWSGATTYAAGRYVVASNVLYFSIQNANLNQAPASSPDWWQNAGSGTNGWANPYPLAVQSMPYFNGRLAYTRNNAVNGSRTYDVITRYTTGSPTPQSKCQAAGTTYNQSWFSLDIGTNDITVIGSAAITNFSITSNVATVTATNTFAVNQYVMVSGLATGTYLNGVYLQVVSASGTQFTANFVHADVGSTADTGTAFTNAATIWYAIQRITRQAKADGCKVALLDLTPRTNTGSMTPALQAELTNLNSYMRAGIVGTDYDAFVDVFAEMGGPNNLAIFPAGLHPSQAGQIRMASLLNRALITQGQPNALPADNLNVPGTGLNNYRATVDALTAATTGTLDTAVGSKALAADTTGTGNTAVGYGALFSELTGNLNTAVGQSAGIWATGINNTLIGNQAAANVAFTGGVDIVIGQGVGAALTTGNNNVFIGGSGATTGSNDTAVGQGSSVGATNANETAVGSSAAATAQNTVQLGSGTNATANTLQFFTWNAMDSSGNSRTNFTVSPVGTAIVAAATIAPITSIVHISGTTAIVNITIPTVAVGGGTFTGCVTLIPDGLWTTTAAGNIALASTAVISKTLTECYDGTKWYPSY